MHNKVFFRGNSNDDFGVIVTRLPDILLAAERGEWVQVLGKSGEDFVPEGALESIPVPLPLWIPPSANIAAVSAWLRGEGPLRVDGWPWFWQARVMSSTPLTPCVGNDGWNATVMLKCSPYRYLWPEAEPMILTSGRAITNPCTTESAPEITVKGSGEAMLFVGGRSVGFVDVGGMVIIDVEKKTAKDADGYTATQRLVLTNGWPTIAPGENAISWAGGITEVQIVPRYRNA